MKKVVLLAMVAMLSFNMVGCGKTEKAADVKPTEAASETEGTSSGNAAMDAYIMLSQSTFDAMAESLKGEMEFKASGEGSTLKYEMKLLTDVDDAEAMQAQRDAQMEAQKVQMEAVVESLKSAGIENPKFIVEYKSKDGDVISTYEFE